MLMFKMKVGTHAFDTHIKRQRKLIKTFTAGYYNNILN